MANFGYTMLGFGSGGSVSPKVYTNTLGTSSYNGIWSAGGDWLYDTDETNTQTLGDNWLMLQDPYEENNYSNTSYAYNTTTHTFTTGTSWNQYALGANSHSGGGVQLSLDRGVWGMRSSAGSFTAYCYVNDLNAGLTGFDNNVQTKSEAEFYNNGYRLDDNTGLYRANSNYPGWHMVTYNGGAGYTLSAKSITAGYAPATDAGRFWDYSSPGSGWDYGNVRTTRTFVYLNSADNYTFTDATTRVDFNYVTWDGSSGTSLSKTDRDSAITLPTHTGSSQVPYILSTSWGNVVIHMDSANPSNSLIYPVTWSGSTQTVGTAVSWNSSIPPHQIFWFGLDGMGRTGYSKYICGQDRSGKTDLYKTFRLYQDGSDMKLTTLTVDFSNSNGSHTVKIKQPNVVTFSSSSSGEIYPLFLQNNTDLAVWHRDTSTFAYIQNAYY